jgi:hypothetical protein
MSNNPKVIMGLYAGLTANEERILKGFDGDVAGVLAENGVNARFSWDSRTDARDRFVRCWIPKPQSNKPIVLLELLSSELATLSRRKLMSRLG